MSKTPNYTESVLESGPDYLLSQLFTLKKFKQLAEAFILMDSDGFGHPALNGKCDPNIMIKPSRRHQIPEDATHIVWFNR